MNKKEAANYLEISVRTLQRYTAQGKISARYNPIKTGAEADYDEEELGRFKSELESRTYAVRPAAVPALPVEQTALAPVATQINTIGERLINALEAIKPATPSLVAIEHKIILSVDEAAALTSLSRNFLLKAIKEGKLKAQIMGRGWRIKRADLDAYVKKI
jgi:excisionase family DNA binding protein